MAVAVSHCQIGIPDNRSKSTDKATNGATQLYKLIRKKQCRSINESSIFYVCIYNRWYYTIYFWVEIEGKETEFIINKNKHYTILAYSKDTSSTVS